MTKVNVKSSVAATQAATPSEQATAKALVSVDIVDSTGRALKLKKPGVLAQYRLIEALGDTASNATYVRMALPLLYVAEIDGEHIFPPTRKSDVEALIQRLDEHGIARVMEAVPEHFGNVDPDADKAAVKN